MSDDNALNDYGIAEGGEIFVEIVTAITIEIVRPDKTCHFEYNSQERIESLIQKVASSWKVEKRQIELRNWRNVTMLNLQESLSDYGIDGNNAQSRKLTLRLLPQNTITITVQSIEGSCIVMSIAKSGTVSELKQRIGYPEYV